MRKAIGLDEIVWRAPVADALQLWDALVAQHPQLKPLASSRVVAVNRQRVAADHPLQDGDEVAFFPPVSGG